MKNYKKTHKSYFKSVNHWNCSPSFFYLKKLKNILKIKKSSKRVFINDIKNKAQIKLVPYANGTDAGWKCFRSVGVVRRRCNAWPPKN